MGLNPYGLVSLDVRHLRISVWDVPSAAQLSPEPTSSQHPAQHHTALQLGGIHCPLSNHRGTYSETDLPKLWSELSREH